ncbi:MAG TPA: helix-turn-helix transcriptional regulator [Chloroflexota bacterium]|jgi:transcriptional regulator with XRE-family HTH domain
MRAARLARRPRMTLAELAGERLSISLVSKIERGLVRPSLPTLEYLSERLGRPLAELIGGPPARGRDDDAALAAGRARADLAGGDPAAALAALANAPSGEAAALRAAALLALDRDDEAIAEVERARAGPDLEGALAARLDLVRGHVLSRRGPADAAQEAFGRALRGLPADDADGRADALLGMARLAERAGSGATARSLYAQALAELAQATAVERRIAALRRRAVAAERSGDGAAAREALAAAAEIAGLADAAARRVEAATRLAELELASGRPEQALLRYREASEAMTHRAVRRPRPG